MSALPEEPPARQTGRVVTLGPRQFDFAREVAVVGIVNRTPDSFYDKGATFALSAATAAVAQAVAEGADWVDIGGVPFGPGPAVSAQEEIDRVLPLVEHTRTAWPELVISVDTTSSEVAAAVLAAGADVINDTSGLHDEQMAATVAQAGAGLVVVHSAAPPRVAIRRPTYRDVVADVRRFLADRVERAVAAGVPAERILVDPGHDLHKNSYHSLELTRRLSELTDLGPPLFVAVSNKDFVGEALDLPVDQRVIGSVVVAAICVLHGARVLRVHNVRETVRAVRTVSAVLGWTKPARPVHNV